MGIYSNGKIFGIKIYHFIPLDSDKNDISNILFEEKYDTIMNHQQMRDAYFFYSNLEDDIKEITRFQIYTECISTLDKTYQNDFVMMWYPLSLETFLDIFSL
jgi:hypothetical protein